ncbi:MAG: hypothetical protein ACK5G9_02205 [Akkermansiaceae bacterium]|jgi:hypothetical protein
MKNQIHSSSVAQIGSLAIIATTMLAFSSAAFAITLSNPDTFTSSLDNWQKGQSNPTYLSVIANGGPAGVGDSYMQSVADGAGSFSRLTVFNQSQWNSNYVSDGVTSIRMDLLNSGSTPLELRLGLRNSAGVGYISTTSFLLATGGNWHSADFPVTEAALTAVGTPGDFSSFLSNGFALRILHATTTANLNGDAVVGTLGVDNVTAIPEPSAAILVGMSGFVLVAAARRRLDRARQS